MKRNLFMYQTPEDGGGAPPADGGGAGGASDWQPTQEWGQRIDQFIESAGPTLTALNEILQSPDDMQQYGQQYGQGFDPYQGQPGQPLFDPYTGQPLQQQQFDPYTGQPLGVDPQQFQQMVQQQAQQIIDQRLGAYEPLLGQIAEREGEQIARQHLEALQREIGDFSQDDAILLAQGYIAQGMEAADALRSAAAYAHERADAIRKQAIEEYKQSLSNAAGAEGDLGAGGAAVSPPQTPTGAGRYEEAVARALSGLSPLSPSDL